MKRLAEVTITVVVMACLLGVSGVSKGTTIPAYPDYVSSATKWEEWSNQAIEWAKKYIGSKKYKDKCLLFVGDAFMRASEAAGRTGVKKAGWEHPNDAIRKLGTNFYSEQKNPPRGALVFFSGQGDPLYIECGHIGISLGNNQVIHAYGIVKEDSISKIETFSYIDSYLGWAYPPKAWYGISGQPLVIDWKEYKLGAVSFAVSSSWEVIYKEGYSFSPIQGFQQKRLVYNSFTAGPKVDYTDKRYVRFAVGGGELPFIKVEPGKTRIFHEGSSGGHIEEQGTTSQRLDITHIGRLVDSFKTEIAGRPVTVCVLFLNKEIVSFIEGFIKQHGRGPPFNEMTKHLENKGVRIEGTEYTKWVFHLYEGGESYHFVLIGADPAYQSAIFKELVTRIRFLPKID